MIWRVWHTIDDSTTADSAAAAAAAQYIERRRRLWRWRGGFKLDVGNFSPFLPQKTFQRDYARRESGVEERRGGGFRISNRPFWLRVWFHSALQIEFVFFSLSLPSEKRRDVETRAPVTWETRALAIDPAVGSLWVRAHTQRRMWLSIAISSEISRSIAYADVSDGPGSPRSRSKRCCTGFLPFYLLLPFFFSFPLSLSLCSYLMRGRSRVARALLL